MSGGPSTTVSSNAPPPEFTAAYKQVNQQAGNQASVPYQPYPGQIVADLSPDQQAGIAQTESAANGIATPYINAAAGYINNATTPIWGGVQQFSPSAISQYENPYTNDVVNATQQQFNNQNAIQQQGIVGNAISQGAFGGDRSAVAQGITAGQQQLAQAPVIAGLRNQAYNQALQEFNQQQGAQIGANEANAWLNSQAGAGMAALGQEALGTSLTGANALLGIGGLEQTQAQAGLNVPYQQYIAQQAYPFQTTGWLANIAEGLGGASGGMSSTTSPSPSVASQLGGGALAATGVLGQTGAFGKSGYLTGSGGLFDGGSGSAGIDQGVWDVARGGGIPHRDAGGGITGFMPGQVPIPTGVPDVSMSIVPGASGADMGTAPASHGTMDILKNYGTTSKTTGGDSIFGTILKTAGNIAASYWGGPAGGAAANALGSQVHFDRGGIIPFPVHRTRTPSHGIIANDDFDPEPVQHRAAGGGYSVSTVPSSHGGPDVPVLSFSGTTSGAPPPSGGGGIIPSGSVQDYLHSQLSHVSATPPPVYTPPPPPPSTATMPEGLTPEAIAYANSQARNLAIMAGQSSSGGMEWRGGSVGHRDTGGGIVALDDGGDVPSETGSIVTGMLDAPAGNRVSPEEANAWWRLHGASPAGASGIVQNMTRESGLRSDIPGDYDRSGNPTSLGLFQHHADREAALKRFATNQGASPTDPYVQMQFAKHELAGDMPGLDRMLATTNDPGAAEAAFRTQFERPKEVSGGDGIQNGRGIFTGAVASEPSGGRGIVPQMPEMVEPPAYSPWRMLTNIGLGILGGKSPNAGVNIGQGALQGVEISDKEKQAEATQALARQQAAATNSFRQASLTLENARANQTERHQTTDEDLRRQGLTQQAARDATSEQTRRDLLEQGRYTSTPVTIPDPDDPTKTISGVQLLNNKTGETTFRRTDATPIKGNASAGMQGREAVFLGRVLTGGHEAVADAQNIMELPITTSSGWFGPREPHTTLLGAVKENLVNSYLTPQEVQDYTTMTAGVSRALSAIEASGLAPNGSLTKSMDTLTLKEGDSQLTKLRRMAQMRQIVEQGMKPILQNPRITPDQKAEAQSIVDGITKAVPITHHDITEFQKQSAKNPGLTLGDMAVKTAGAQSGQSTQQTQPSTAAAPQQNAAPSGTPYQHSATGPGGVKVYSPDGKSWFTRDGKPYAP